MMILQTSQMFLVRCPVIACTQFKSQTTSMFVRTRDDVGFPFFWRCLSVQQSRVIMRLKAACPVVRQSRFIVVWWHNLTVSILCHVCNDWLSRVWMKELLHVFVVNGGHPTAIHKIVGTSDDTIQHSHWVIKRVDIVFMKLLRVSTRSAQRRVM